MDYEKHQTETRQWLKDASNTFHRLMEPELLKYFDRFHSCETHETELDAEYDSKYGIDGFLYSGNFAYSLAIRGEFQGNCERTFTIKECRETSGTTGYKKLVQLISSGQLYPEYFLEYYTNEQQDELYCYGIVRTQVLVDVITSFIRSNEPHPHIRLCPNTMTEAHSWLYSIDFDYIHQNYGMIYYVSPTLPLLIGKSDNERKKRLAERWREMNGTTTKR